MERTTEYLQLFFRNLLMGERNELRNRYLHIRWNKMLNNDPVVNEDYAPFVAQHSSVEIKNSSVEINKGSVENKKSSVQNKQCSVQNEKSSVEIIRMISENPKITAAQMAEKLGVTTRAIEKQLANLRKKGTIARIGPNKGGRWEITQEI